MSMTVFVTLVIWSCLLYWLEHKKLEKNDIERAERASQKNLCTFASEKCFTYRPETREKAIINDCEQSNCVCVCLKHAILLIRVGSRGRLTGPGGVQGQSPCRGPRGQSPRKLSSFQQIRAFKMVVRSDRNCNFSSCNFAYRALVGGRGCGSHQIFRSSWKYGFFNLFFFFFFLQYVPENICNWLQASEPKFSYFALKTCDC